MALEQIGVEATIQGLSSFRRGINQMEGDVRGFGRSTDGLLPGLNSMGDSLLKIGGIAAGAVVAGLAAATGAAVAFAGSGIKAAIDMEDQMGNIAAVMNTSKDAIQPLADLILELGIDPGLKVTAEEAAQAIELLARNGLSMTEILDGAAKSTVLLANATGADFGVAADIATDAMAIFGIGAEDMVSVVDSIVSVTTNSKFTIDDFSLAIRNGGAAADLMGVSLDDFNTVIAATAEEMGSGMRAGTGFRNFLMRLTPNSEAAADAMMELGLITADGANQFFDAEGNIKSMAEVSGILGEALNDLTAEEQSAFLELIFGQDALGTAIGLANEGEEGFRALAESMSETDAAAAALERMDSVAGVMEILGGVIDTVQLQIGQAFLPLIRDLADRFLVLTNEVGPLLVEFFSSFADSLTVFVDALIVGNTPLTAFLMGLSEMGVSTEAVNNISNIATSIQGFITTIVEFVTQHSEAFKGAIIGIGAVLAGSVIISIVTAIVGAIATILSPIGLLVLAIAGLSAVWSSNWGDIQGKTAAALEFIQGIISTGVAAIQSFWDAHGEAIVESAQVAWEFIKTNIETALSIVESIFTAFKLAFEGDWRGFGENLRAAWDTAWARISDILTDAKNMIVGIASGLILDLIAKFHNTDWLAVGTAIVQGIANGIQNGAGAIADAAMAAAQAALDAAKGFLGIESPSKVFMEIGENIGAGLVIGIQSMQGTVQETIKALFDVGGALGGIGSGFASQLKNDVFPQMEETITQNQQLFDALKNKFAGNFGGMFGLESGEDVSQQKLIDAYFFAVHSGNEQMKNDVLAIWQAQNQLNSATAEYEEAQASILALQKAQQDLAFLQQQQELLDLITEHGLNASEILGGLELGLGADTQGLVEAMTRAIQAIIDQANDQLQIASPSGIFKEIGKFITSGLAEGISQTATNPTHAMESMLAQMTPGVSSQAAMPSVINQPSTTTITKTANVDMTGAQISNEMDLQRIGDVLLQRVAESI